MFAVQDIRVTVLVACIVGGLAACGGGDAGGPLKGTRANVTVTLGCDCIVPAAGSVEVIASAPQGVTLLDAEVSGEGWPRQFRMTLEPTDAGVTCDGQLLAGFAGADYAGFDNELPDIGAVTPEKVQLRLHYQADGKDEWAELSTTSVCMLPLYGF